MSSVTAFIKRWYQFKRERFEPFSHLLMISVFFGANFFLSKPFLFQETVEGFRVILALIITFLFFFHLRQFDELKDYQTDLNVNQTRPLPRGLISIREFKIVLYCVQIVELGLAAYLSLSTLAAFLLPFLYSHLMYREFFIGNWLRPKMEAYAISHTLVSGFLGLFIACACFNVPIGFLPFAPFLLLCLLNWMIFNTFEFARKTFGREEERPTVESYSSRWNPLGASLWTIGFTALNLIFIYRFNLWLGWSDYFFQSELILTLILWTFALIYSFQPSKGWAKTFRTIASLYLITFNAIIAVFGILGLR